MVISHKRRERLRNMIECFRFLRVGQGEINRQHTSGLNENNCYVDGVSPYGELDFDSSLSHFCDISKFSHLLACFYEASRIFRT